MLLEEHICTHGLIPGFICIIDSTGPFVGTYRTNTSSNLLNKALTYIKEALPRLKVVHFINLSPAIELYNMFKSLLNKKLIQLIHFHSSIESAQKYFSIDALPDECGGNASPNEEFREACVKKIEDFREWLLEDEKVSRVNESLRIGESKTSNDLFGVIISKIWK